MQKSLVEWALDEVQESDDEARRRTLPQTNGPLLIEGNLEICAASGRTVARQTRATLCRCGGSANKPFCDGTHKKNGFVG